MNAADKIVVTSQGLLENSRTLASYRDKCKVVPLSVDLGKVKRLSAAEVTEVRGRYGICECSKVVLFAGRLVYYKGLQYLIDAVRDLDLQLLIAGDGPLRPMLEKQIEEGDLGERIQILGRVTDSELADLYAISDLFVLPSTEPSEAFGLVQLDAMAYGLPVINTDLPSGVPTVSIHGQTGLTVPPADPVALREAVAEILSDDGLRVRFSQNARQRVLEDLVRDHDRIARVKAQLRKVVAPTTLLGVAARNVAVGSNHKFVTGIGIPARTASLEEIGTRRAALLVQ
jgi:rhamnosyl/mannosyltransferase